MLAALLSVLAQHNRLQLIPLPMLGFRGPSGVARTRTSRRLSARRVCALSNADLLMSMPRRQPNHARWRPQTLNLHENIMHFFAVGRPHAGGPRAHGGIPGLPAGGGSGQRWHQPPRQRRQRRRRLLQRPQRRRRAAVRAAVPQPAAQVRAPSLCCRGLGLKVMRACRSPGRRSPTCPPRCMCPFPHMRE